MFKLLQTKSQGLMLRQDLQSTLRQLGISATDEMFAKTQCFVKDKKIKESQFRVKSGALVTFLVPPEIYTKPFFVINSQMIVFEDDAIVVVDKPSGVSTQGTQKFGEDHLYGALISYYTKPHANKLGYVGLHHRLDRDTSGLVLFTKKSSANKSIAEQFQNHNIKKKYHAVVVGPKPEKEQWTCEEPIQRDFTNSKLFRFRVHPKGDTAKTTFRWIKELSPNNHLIECVPYTGRTHQIRIHLKYANLPILGDRTYGRDPHARMMLHASELKLDHPLVSKKELIIQSKQSLF
ncbi:MAG: RluA family pseudouridine synthase [Bdellovibrionaceae bacterium]|nr:RluA family pseudouridine synthase [Pseudobdellovibrionaceae bacterium]